MSARPPISSSTTTSAMEPAPPKVKCPKGVTADQVYSLVIATSKEVKEAKAATKRNQACIRNLADDATTMKKQMKAMERREVKGTIKIDGKNLPPRVPKEHLLKVVRNLAIKYLGIRISSHDISHLTRMNVSPKSPILVKFVSTHSGAVVYDITNPLLRKRMAKDKIFWSRYQIPTDHTIFRVASQLRKAGLIFGYLVDQNHLTCVLAEEDSRPLIIHEMTDFAVHFANNPGVSDIVRQWSGRDIFDEEMDTAAAPTAPTNDGSGAASKEAAEAPTKTAPKSGSKMVEKTPSPARIIDVL